MFGYDLILKLSDISLKYILSSSSTMQLTEDYSIATFPMHPLMLFSDTLCFDFY